MAARARPEISGTWLPLAKGASNPTPAGRIGDYILDLQVVVFAAVEVHATEHLTSASAPSSDQASHQASDPCDPKRLGCESVTKWVEALSVPTGFAD